MAELPYVTKLYLHTCSYGSCPDRYSKFADHDSEEANLEQSLAGVPIVHRQVYHHKTWRTRSFTIQDPDMRAHLLVALSNYQDFDLELEDWTFEEPYNPIVHRWQLLNTLCEETVDPVSKEKFEQMMDFIRPIVAASVNSLSQTRASGKVSFNDIWQIFPPRELSITTFFGVDVVCRVLKYEKVRSYEGPYWSITMEYIDWNGEKCGYATTKATIKPYAGYRFVTSLPVYPLTFSTSEDYTKMRLVKRGREAEALRGYHLRTCKGTKILLEAGHGGERPVDGRVIIDGFAYYQSNNIVKPSLRPLNNQDDSDSENEEDKHSRREDSGGSDSGSVASGDVLEEGPEMATTTDIPGESSRVEDLTPLTDEECLLVNPWLRGLDLRTKEWAQFLVDDLTNVEWNNEAFDRLVLPGNEKELAWAFVENKALSTNKFDDFVEDKGRGIIILMFGPPGVGKTYTAEAVAERSQVPLYSMSAGMLGTNSATVEAALDRALGLCKLWNAMLLLDEVDVFLGARRDNDLARNELVAIFLTKLEYYQGICFLTTNRVTSLDHAFQSRVDLFLRYDDLTTNARRQVWQNFINRAGSERFDVSDEDLGVLSQVKLNGREIKNLIKSANLLSLKGQEKITAGRLTMLANNRRTALDALNGSNQLCGL